MQVEYIWSQHMLDQLAEKVANEKMKDQYIDHVEDEEEMERQRELERDRKQMDLFNDPDWNWSGLR